jgi:hypothetical protein
MLAAQNRITHVLLVLVLLALLAMIAMMATDARSGPLDPPGTPGPTTGVLEAGTPISSAPMTISAPGRYYLTQNITVSGAVTAITIAASNVSLDLGGFTIRGNNTAGSFGINAFGGQFNIEITHGTVQSFHIGISTLDAQTVRLNDVHAHSNIRGIQMGDTSTLSNCSSIFNDETGIYLPEGHVFVSNCLVKFNDSDGISILGAGTIVERSTFIGNAFGDPNIYVDVRLGGSGHTFRENVVDFHDIRLEGSGSNILIDNACMGATIVNASAFPGTNRIAEPDHLNVNCVLE